MDASKKTRNKRKLVSNENKRKENNMRGGDGVTVTSVASAISCLQKGCPDGADDDTVSLFKQHVAKLRYLMEEDERQTPGNLGHQWLQNATDGSDLIEVFHAAA
ncbi:hypothetical protein B0H13DRAFT_2278451 [Mycena leptocephala]|nr:hypothetical protein B0H13DRAFT_2278451 [Mycena leptocephala]